jgi:predicted dehydrogenase
MRIAVVGTGSIGMRHLRLLGEVPEVVPVAVPVRPQRVAELRALGYEAAASLDEALAQAPAGVIVATDTGRHAADVELCLRHAPVLVEKPMTVNAREAARMVDTARALGRGLHVACCLRFDEGLAWAHARREAIGAPVFLDVECLSWLPSWRPTRDHLSTYSARPGEGGVLLDLIHEVDSAFWFAGPYRVVTAELDNAGLVGLPKTVEETAVLSARHASGLRSAVRLSFAVRPPVRRLRMWGTAGALVWDGIERRAVRLDSEGVERESTSWGGPDQMYRAQRDAWLAALRGEPSPRLVPGTDGWQALSACDAARRSAARGAREEVA